MDASLRENGALIQGKGGALLFLQSVFEDEARADVCSFGEGQDLCRSGVDVGFVHPAWVHEPGGHGDAEVGERREGFAIGEIALASETFASTWVGVGGWVEVIFEPGVGGAEGGEEGEAVFACWGGDEFGVQIVWNWGVGGRDRTGWSGGVGLTRGDDWGGGGGGCEEDESGSEVKRIHCWKAL